MKQPYFVCNAQDKALVLAAGIYDVWHSSDGMELTSFAIITVDGASSFQWLHDRMPAFLQSEREVDEWLSAKPFSDVRRLLRPQEQGLRWWPVTDKIGKLGYQGEDATKPVEIAKLRGGSSIDKFFAKKPKLDSPQSAAAAPPVAGDASSASEEPDAVVDLT